jgi:hypothetical protein
MAQPDFMEMIKSFFGQSHLPGFAGLPLSGDEIERKIAELRQVENWLLMNLNVLKGQLQVLEAQKQMMSVFSGGTVSASAPSATDPAAGPGAAQSLASNPMLNPAAWMQAMQTHMQPFLEASAAAGQTAPKKRTPAPKAANLHPARGHFETRPCACRAR